MKKLLLVAATTSALLTSFGSFACQSCDEKGGSGDSSANISNSAGTFYGKIEGGASFLNNTKDKFWDKTMKSKDTAGIFGFGLGYYILDNLRTDLTVDFLTKAKFKRNLLNLSAPKKVNIKHSGENIMSVMLNGYYDLYDLGMFRSFIGAGIGWGQLKEKVHVLEDGALTLSGSSKKSNNFVYQLSVGGSIDIAQDVKGELSYRWVDYGKTKYIRKNSAIDAKKYGKTRYATHNIIAGLRFSM